MQGQEQNAQNQFAKECIFTALMQLMEATSFSDISITEITRKAGVSRMAYYRNYGSKEDIIIQYLNALFQVYLEEIRSYGQVDVFQFAYRYFAYFRKHEVLIKNLLRSNLWNLLLERFDTYLHSIVAGLLTHNITSPELKAYEVHFLAGGLYKILIEWVQNDMAQSDEEMAALICKLAPSSIQTQCCRGSTF
jgi:AcrR family transcriptional regulator